MKLETFKTIILTILVGISLLLTFSLWNYQPNYDPLYPTSSNYVNEVDAGGIEETKRSIIEPINIVFHYDGETYGFEKRGELQFLYKHIQEWMLNSYELTSSDSIPTNSNQVEVIFPNPMPMEMIKSLFTLKDNDSLPTWSFQRILITFNESYSSLNVYFLSIDGREQVKYVVNNATVYTHIASIAQNQQGLVEYSELELNDSSIYIPKNEVDMRSRSLAVETISPTLFVDALFTNPSLVSPNVGEAYFTDGQRGMDIMQNGLFMQFINPIHSNTREKDPIDLIEKSLLKINEHKGWTDEYRLENIDLNQNAIRYQLHYEGYPVYNSSGLAMIEQQWRNQELHKYSRPLFNLNNVLGGRMVTLQSGQEVIDYIVEESDYDLSQIKDIRAGYKLEHIEGASYSVIVEPAWLINYRGVWRELKMNDFNEGGE